MPLLPTGGLCQLPWNGLMLIISPVVADTGIGIPMTPERIEFLS
jgi:hypothetical protein